MTLAYASATRSALRTTTGTQDFTAPSFGTPVGAIVLLTNATADGTDTATKRWSIGFTDGTRHRVAAAMSQDNVTTSSNYKATGSARLALLIKTDGSASDVEVQFDSFITDGIRLNVSTTDGTAYLCTVILFGGADCDLYVNEFDIGSVTAGATLDVTDAGFQPSFIFFVQSGGAFSIGSPTPSAGEMMSLSFAADTGANEQARFTYGHGNAKTTSEPSLNTPATITTNITNVLTPAPLSPSTGAGLKLNSYLSTGFQVISPNGGDTPPVAYLAVTFGTTPDIALVTTPTTATTRTVSMTDPGCAFFLNTIAAATGNLAGNTAGQVGFGFANNEVAFCVGQREHDAVTTMDNGVISDDVPIHLLLDDGSAIAIKATASFSTTELTLTYSDVQSTARNNYVLLLPRPTFSGSGAGTLGALTASGTAVEVFSGSGAGTLGALTASGTAFAVTQLTIAAQAQQAVAALDAQVIHQASPSAAAQRATADVAVALVHPSSVPVQAQRATAALVVQVIHQASAVTQAQPAVAALDSQVVHQAAVITQAQPATTVLDSQVIHQTSATAQAQQATTTFASQLVHPSSVAAQAQQATTTFASQLVHPSSVAVQAQRATAALASQLVHQVAVAVQAQQAATALVATVVHQATSTAQAQPATTALDAQLIHQTTVAAVAQRATTDIAAELAGLKAAAVNAQAQQATAAVAVQVIHQATGAATAQRATTTIQSQPIHQVSVIALAPRATAALSTKFVYTATVVAQANRAALAVQAQRIAQAALFAQAQRAQMDVLDQLIHQGLIDAVAMDATAHLFSGQGTALDLACVAQRATAHLTAQLIHQCQVDAQAEPVRCRILQVPMVWYTPQDVFTLPAESTVFVPSTTIFL